MLDQGKLKDNIQKGIEEHLTPALEIAFKTILPNITKEGNELSKQFADTAVNIFAEPFAETLSSAIDYYIKNAQIDGKCLLLGVTTVGGCTSQSQVAPLPLTISTKPTGLGGGKIPGQNEFILGIS